MPTVLVPRPIVRMGSAGVRRNILGISIAEAANSAYRGHALFPSGKTAILAAAVVAAAVIRTPWIILGLGVAAKRSRTNENSQYDQRDPHSGLLALRCLAVAGFHRPRNCLQPRPAALRNIKLRTSSPLGESAIAVRPVPRPAFGVKDKAIEAACGGGTWLYRITPLPPAPPSHQGAAGQLDLTAGRGFNPAKIEAPRRPQ